jgi:hypothetical protein
VHNNESFHIFFSTPNQNYSNTGECMFSFSVHAVVWPITPACRSVLMYAIYILLRNAELCNKIGFRDDMIRLAMSMRTKTGSNHGRLSILYAKGSTVVKKKTIFPSLTGLVNLL